MMRRCQKVKGRYEKHLNGNLLIVEESYHDADRVVTHACKPQAGKTSMLKVLVVMLPKSVVHWNLDRYAC